MLIVLSGYMGSGKSLVGAALAEKLNYDFIDLDDFIVQQEKMSIAALFRIKGEIYFRKKELLYLQELLKDRKKTVLALGGGTPCYGKNMELILEHTPHVFYLKATIETLVHRLKKEQQQRPLIKDIQKEKLSEFIRKHLFERNYYYLKSPNVIAIDGLQPSEVAEFIMAHVS